MSVVRTAVANAMNRIIRSSGESCQLHRLYKISFANGKSYVGQTKKLPEERAREHARNSSKCTKVLEEMRRKTPFRVETIAVTGAHNIDALEKVAIAIEKTLVSYGGLNITVGGPGVKKANDEYEKFADEVKMVYAKIAKGHHVSYDIMFMKGETVLTEEEFKAIRTLKRP
jgi:hypothetical protein